MKQGQKAINFWMAHGVSVPGWLIVRSEISADAKFLYGFLLAEKDSHVNPEDPSDTSPLFDAERFAETFQWSMDRFKAAWLDLQENDLAMAGNYKHDKEGVIRFDFMEHPWADACFYEIPSDEVEATDEDIKNWGV